MSLPPNPLKGELPNNEVQMDFDMENTPFRGQGVDLVLHYDQLMTEYYECPVGAVDKLAEIENVRLLIEKTKMKSIDLPISKHVKQLIIQLFGNEPVNILSITTEKEYRKFKFSAEKVGDDAEERMDKTTIRLSYPLSMSDLFGNADYWYQAEFFLNKVFDRELIKHIKIQIRTGSTNARSSIVDFFQMYGISKKDISIDTCRKKWERHLKKAIEKEQLTINK